MSALFADNFEGSVSTMACVYCNTRVSVIIQKSVKLTHTSSYGLGQPREGIKNNGGSQQVDLPQCEGIIKCCQMCETTITRCTNC
jgi:hypothetical protein